MSDPEATNPPPVPNTPRKALAWLWSWSQAHTVVATAIGAFLAGFIVGKL